MSNEEEAPRANPSRDDQANTNFPSSSNAVVPRPPTAPWLRLKDPRIVRVSRAFGGKDRHSKVCTIRGLRDRRVRLSVPTAIQLYDLQERLGLNQPSKVVDWLLDAAKHEIDDLPPLPLPPPSANFGEGPSGTSTNFWTSTISDAIWRAKSKEMAKEKEEERAKEMRTSNNVDGGNSSSSINDHPFFPGLLNNALPNYGYHQNWEPSSSSVNFGLSQATDLHNFINVVSLPSTLSLATTQSYFPSHNVAAAAEIDPRQFNHHLQVLSSGSANASSSTSNSENLLANSVLGPGILYPNSQNVRGSYLSMMTKLAHSSNNQPSNKDQESP